MKSIRILGVLAVISLAGACSKTAAAGPGHATSTSSSATTAPPATSPANHGDSSYHLPADNGSTNYFAPNDGGSYSTGHG